MEKNKSKNMAVCIICGILTLVGMIISISSIVSRDFNITMINDIIDLVTAILICYYAFYGYKKPKGNLLKYILLVFAVPFVISVYSKAMKGDPSGAVIRTITVGMICYIAGRLHRVKQNLVLMIIVTILILSTKAVKIINGGATISSFSSFILWVDICVAYFLRYKEHKEAGIMDAPGKS